MMGLFDKIGSAILGTKEQRLIANILAKRYQFSGPNDDWTAGREHYATLLQNEGFAPAELAGQIEAALQVSYDVQFQCGVHAPGLREQHHKPKPVLKPGDRDFIRQEALRTFQSTGVFGLPSYGGHILTAEERKVYGLP